MKLIKQLRPSYRNGYAKSAAESAYPTLWRGLKVALVPELGNTGRLINAADQSKDVSVSGTGVIWGAGHLAYDDFSSLYDNAYEYAVSDAGKLGTLFARVRPSSSTSGVVVGMQASGATLSQDLFFIAQSSSSWQVRVEAVTLTAGTITENAWTTVCARFVSDVLRELYVNGAFIASNTTSRTVATGDYKITVGGWDNAGTPTNEFLGDIGCAYYFDRVLTPDEIAQLAENPLAPFELKPITSRFPVAAPAAGNPAATEDLFSWMNFVSGPAVHATPLWVQGDAIGQDDRQHLLDMYSGVLFGTGGSTVTGDADDTISITDTSSVVITAPVASADSLTIVDTSSVVITAVVTSADSLSITDTASNVITAPVTASDSAVLTDTATAILVVPATSADTLSIVDTASNVLTARSTSADSLTLADTATNVLTGVVTSSDGLTLTDTVTASVAGTITGASEDTLTITDTASNVLTGVVTAADTISITDTATSTVVTPAALAEALSMVDVSSATLTAVVTSADAVTISDTALANLIGSTAAADSAVFTDSVTANIPGSGQTFIYNYYYRKLMTWGL